MLTVTITVKRPVTQYGTYDIEVPDDATREEIEKAAEERFEESDPDNMQVDEIGESEIDQIEVEGIPLDEYETEKL